MHPLTLGLVIANRDLLAEVQANLRTLPVRVVLEQPEIRDREAFAEKLVRLRPDVVLLDVSDASLNIEETVRLIRNSPGDTKVVAVHTVADPSVILRAIRSGASEYLFPPFDDGLRAALTQISADRSQQKREARRGKVAGFLSVKGGCGATTVACHAGVELHRNEQAQVLLADLDTEAGLLGFLLKAKSSYTILNALENLNRLDLSYWKALVAGSDAGVDVILAPINTPGWQPVAYDRFQPLLRLVRSYYDFVIADLGGGLGMGVVSALEEMDAIYLVTTIDVPALYCARQAIRRLRDTGYDPSRIHTVLNRVPRRPEVTPDDVQQMLDTPIAAAIPDDPGALYECYADGKLLPSKAAISKKIAELAGKMANGFQNSSAKRASLISRAGG